MKNDRAFLISSRDFQSVSEARDCFQHITDVLWTDAWIGQLYTPRMDRRWMTMALNIFTTEYIYQSLTWICACSMLWVAGNS
jgi:hypothetical protein